MGEWEKGFQGEQGQRGRGLVWWGRVLLSWSKSYKDEARVAGGEHFAYFANNLRMFYDEIRAGVVAQMVDQLPSKHEALSSNSNTTKKKETIL
jgi:hypothetical protein